MCPASEKGSPKNRCQRRHAKQAPGPLLSTEHEAALKCSKKSYESRYQGPHSEMAAGVKRDTDYRYPKATLVFSNKGEKKTKQNKNIQTLKTTDSYTLNEWTVWSMTSISKKLFL